jgi:hypothetical protein
MRAKYFLNDPFRPTSASSDTRSSSPGRSQALSMARFGADIAGVLVAIEALA